MSDLIIKPSGTNANFKVQNPSGTVKITMDSDGVTPFTSNVATVDTSTSSKNIQTGAFMQSSFHQAWVMGG